MITYSKSGHCGRLGNQLFQTAATYGIAKKLGYDVRFPIENSIVGVTEHFRDGITREVTFDVPTYFKFDTSLLEERDKIKIEYEYQEPHFHFSETAFQVPDNCDIKGYFQTEKYFKHCEGEIRQLLAFKDVVTKSTVQKFSHLLNSGRTTSIHFRFGDYVGLQSFHPILDETYYATAIASIDAITDKFLIFSDNIEYCKDIFSDNKKIVYIEEGSDIEQMCLMSRCNNNIIANSSFSWWAAWLNWNLDKKVIAPKKWFGPAYANTHDTKDLYPEKWTII